MKELIEAGFRESSELKARIASDASLIEQIAAAAELLRKVTAGGGTVYACGNGGSACDAMHLCEELVARFKRERKGFRAMHFMDPGVVTCWANDYAYESAFARCAETFCTSKDVLIGFSTSGNSQNVLEAVLRAKEKGCPTLGLAGKDGGRLRTAADHCIVVPSSKTERVQEAHITIVHILCELLETE